MVVAITVAATLLPTPAHADPPVAPPVTGGSAVSFIVPPTVEAVVGVDGLYSSDNRLDDARSFNVRLSCDDGWVVPVAVNAFPPGFVSDLPGGAFYAYIPAFEQGHRCTIYGFAPAERRLVLGDPVVRTSPPGHPHIAFTATTVTLTRTGGL